MVKLAVAVRNVVKVLLVHQESLVVEIKMRNDMEPIELEPKYSGYNIAGKCLKCLAEQKLDICLRELLISEDNEHISQQKYEALQNFLRSPESEKLRAESELYLSEGKQVILKISYEYDQPKYEIKIQQDEVEI